MKTRQLRGDPAATLGKAREILRVARREADGQAPGSLGVRQAAEKVWLATTTVADALVGPTATTKAVFGAFRRSWGAAGEQVARDINVALHHGCFYSGAKACDASYVDTYAGRLGKLLGKRPRSVR